MTVNKITKAPTQNEIINSINDLIDNKQDTLIAGTDLEIINAVTPLLPTGYTELEYIEGTGTQYIDTGFYGTENSGAYVRFAITDQTSNGSPRIFGTRNGTSGTGAFAFISSFDGTSLAGDYFYIAANGGYVSQRVYSIDSSWKEVSCNVENDKKSYFNNNLLFTGNSTAFTSNAQASIFRTYNRTNYGLPATAKISVVRIYENAILVHNYIPCRRDSDNALGMYDLVSNTFLGNSGTGTFTGGPEVIYPTTTTINFTNASGYTTNEGTVTSVNNTQPDASGDVTLTIPTVNDGVLTFTQNGTSKGTFSANQSSNDTIALTDTTYNNFTGADGTNAGSSGLVPAPSATDNDKYLKGDGTWASVSGGSSTDVQINGTSITSGGVANIVTNTAYNASSNKIATMSDIQTYTNGTGISIGTGNAINHTNSVTAGTIGTSSATSGSTISVPYANYDAQGHITSKGTHTHTVTGFLTSSSTQVASSRFDGQWVAKTKDLSSATTQGTYTLDLSTYLPDTNNKYEVIVVYTVNSKKTSVAYTTLYSDLIPITENILNIKTSSTSHTLYNGCLLNIPVQRYLYFKISNNGVDGTYIGAVAYRRIGTNT